MGANCSRAPRQTVRSPPPDFKFQFHIFCGEDEDDASKFVKRLELGDGIDVDDGDNGNNANFQETWYHEGGCITHSNWFGSRCGNRARAIQDQFLYSSGREAAIIVVDSTSSMKDIKDQCRFAGIEMISDILMFRNVVFMIVADKQDVEGAHSPEEIESAIREMAMDRWYGSSWFVLPCHSLTNDDVKVAYRYLRKMSRLKSKGQLEPSLIPAAYAWEQANQIEENEEDEEEEKDEEDEKDCVPLDKPHGIIKSLKMNLKLFKSFLSH